MRGTTVGDLYNRYIELTMAYSQSISILTDMPGRKLTSEITNSIIARHPVPNPFELEMLDCDKDLSDNITTELGLDMSTVRGLVLEGIGAARDVIREINTRYLPNIGALSKFKDEAEEQFLHLAREYGERHKRYLSKLIEMTRSSNRQDSV